MYKIGKGAFGTLSFQASHHPCCGAGSESIMKQNQTVFINHSKRFDMIKGYGGQKIKE
jgi:hypothetical protein